MFLIFAIVKPKKFAISFSVFVNFLIHPYIDNFYGGGSLTTNRMSHLEIFIGTWNTTGEVLETDDAPATTLLATDTYQWLPGKHFIMHEADAHFGETPMRSMEVIGYDPESKKYIARSYDDQGISEVFAVMLEGKNWNITGESVRFSGRFDAKGNTLTGLWELKSKTSGWQPWIKLKLVRA